MQVLPISKTNFTNETSFEGVRFKLNKQNPVMKEFIDELAIQKPNQSRSELLAPVHKLLNSMSEMANLRIGNILRSQNKNIKNVWPETTDILVSVLDKSRYASLVDDKGQVVTKAFINNLKEFNLVNVLEGLSQDVEYDYGTGMYELSGMTNKYIEALLESEKGIRVLDKSI